MTRIDLLKSQLGYQRKTLLEKFKLTWYTKGFWPKTIYVLAHISLAIYLITLIAYALK